MSLRYVELDTPLGDLTVVASSHGVIATLSERERAAGALEGIELAAGDDRPRAAPAISPRSGASCAAYFAGRLREFTIPVDLRSMGSGFARRTLEAVCRIPYGETRTYGDVADAAGSPRAGRAAGSALRRCPVEILVPCHRVVGSGRELGGYGGHDDRKRFLLRFEGSV